MNDLHQRKIKSKMRVLGNLVMFVCFCGCMLFFSFSETKKSSRPNIVVILIDDAGYADFGFAGSKDLITPNIDKLAAQSFRFTDAHASSSVCSPSRAGLLTGQYQQRFGYECNEGEGYTGLSTAQVLLPQYLQQAGYRTAAFGKWHLGFAKQQHPLQKGFEYYYGFLSGSRSYFYRPQKDDKAGSRSSLMENYTPVKFNGYLTDILGDKAAAFINEQKNNEPFFMYWAPNAVHTPMEASDDDLKKFEKHPRKQLAAMTYALDRAVGKITDALKKKGMLDNTIIFFLSDNGGAHNNQSDNTPLKGFKGNEFEAGHRVPFLMSWPEKFRNVSPFTGLTSSLDIFATALDAAGIQKENVDINGVSLLPFLQQKNAGNPHQQLVWRKDAAAAIRFNNFKLVRVRGLGETLYDLKNDPGETNDLSAINKQLSKDMLLKLNAWEKNTIPPLWKEGAIWDTITLMIHDDLMHDRAVRVKDPAELSAFRMNAAFKK